MSILPRFLKSVIVSSYIISVISIQTVSDIIDDFLTKSRTEKVLALFNELRSGRHYAASKVRKLLVENYKNVILSLTDEEYTYIKNIIIEHLPKLINERNSRKIAYSMLSDFIKYSCRSGDFDVFAAYEKEILRLASNNKEKYIIHLITLAQTRKTLLDNITNIEDFFIAHYLKLSRLKSINYRHLIEFTTNVSSCDKKRFLIHLIKLKPFRNDFIITDFIIHHKDLQKLQTLI
jgi:hypothetical protein